MDFSKKLTIKDAFTLQQNNGMRCLQWLLVVPGTRLVLGHTRRNKAIPGTVSVSDESAQHN